MYIFTSIKNAHSNALVERVHQVIYNLIVTKNLDKTLYNCIDYWGEILATVVWEVREYCHCTLSFTPGQVIFGRGMLFNLMSIVDWCVITSDNYWQA